MLVAAAWQTDMSIKDYTAYNSTPHNHGGLTRSRSFGGFLNKPPSPTSPLWGTPVLGESFRGTKTSSRKYPGLKKSMKVPKTPKPSRTLLIFESVKRGVRECVAATEEDVRRLKTVEDMSVGSSTGQQLKAAERYKKRLEFHLAKIEELEDNYNLHQQLREGAKNMAKAYVSSPGGNKKECLVNVKCGYKECTQVLCAIEAQLQTMLGTFHCKMKGLVGFARLIHKDVFEVCIRHGQQKWKSKGRIGLNSQNWNRDTTVFKALVGEILHVKASEVKGLGKTVTLGEKHCETKDLFSSHPQLMTVCINTNGSVKLNVVITWNPLDGVDDSVHFFDPPSRCPSISGRCQNTSGRPFLGNTVLAGDTHMSLFNGAHRDSFSDTSSDRDSYTGPTCPGDRFSAPNMPTSSFCTSTPTQPHQLPQRPRSVAIMGTIEELECQQHSQRMFDRRRFLSSPAEIEEDIRQDGGCLEEALQTLKSTLEDYQGRYDELRNLEQQVDALDSLLKESAGALGARSSDVSISIETVLGAFDFLESEDYVEGYGSMKNSRRSSLDRLESDYTLSPESTTKTADSGIESLANRLSEASVCNSPESTPSTGNDQVDEALLWHLGYCTKLLDNLGSYGPMKCREIYSLDKLRRQADILESLIKQAKTSPIISDIDQVVSCVEGSRGVKLLWLRCVDHQPLLSVNAEKFLAHLEHSYGDLIRDRYDFPASRVFKSVVARILDMPVFDPESCAVCPHVTMYQVLSFFRENGQCDIRDYLQDVATEMWMSGRLRSGQPDLVVKTLLPFRQSLPPPSCLQAVGSLLLDVRPDIRKAAANYLQSVSGKSDLRQKAVVVFVEGLEDTSPDVRRAACTALNTLKARECVGQLVYICQSDDSGRVKQAAKEALLSFGEGGRRAFEESQLGFHGFQGFSVQL